jgi:polyferredoxin
MQRYAVSEIPLLKRALRSRWPQWLLVALMLGFFVVAILAGLLGTPAGNRNFGIVFVWIVWWALLMLMLVPVFGRLWCGICPIPAPGEWLQRRTLVAPLNGGKLYTLGKKWPARFRNIWLQNIGFLGIALFSTVILTTPQISALVLLGFVLVAIATSLVFERRTFCRYLCPVGGFIGLYSQVAPVELRVKDRDVCASHREKSCYTGSADGYGCPWLVFPGNLTSNTYCGLCSECLKTCTLDNVAIYIRPPGKDLVTPQKRGVDEAFKGLIMLACAAIYSAVLIGPWGALKDAARAPFTLPWLGYAAAFLLLNLVVIPGLFWLAVRVSDRLGSRPAAESAQGEARKRFAEYATVLVPLGLAAWIAFSLAFVTINFSYAWPSLSDPFGWGWNLFGTAALPWTPYLSGVVPSLQTPVLLVGMAWAIALALRTARRHGRPSLAALPVIAFCALSTVGLLALYLA